MLDLLYHMFTCNTNHNFTKLLKERGVRPTQKRLYLLELLHTLAPASADDLFAATKGKVDRVTVYRTLHALEECGVLQRVDISSSKRMYELSVHHAHYVVCTHCGAHEMLSHCSLEHAEKIVVKKVKIFAHIDGHSLHFFGVCKKCV